MKRYIVLSVNDNQDYLYFTPLVCWAWRQFGWFPIVLFQRSDDINKVSKELSFAIENSHCYRAQISEQEGYRSDTTTQISRLYGAMTVPLTDDAYIMTGDIDMVPLSDYWKADPEKVTVWGHDLTGFTHYPICYIGMIPAMWHGVMKIWDGDINKVIKRDLDTLPQAKDSNFYKYWFSDQDLVTQRLNEYGKEKITFINRGQGAHSYARGRVDRGSGGWVLNQPELIDAHLEQQTHHSTDKINRLYELLAHVWPSENFEWFRNYTNKFRELTNHHG